MLAQGGPHPSCPDVGRLSLRQQVAQTLFVGDDGSSPSRVRRLARRAAPPGGVFLSGTGTATLRDGVLPGLRRSHLPPLVAVDDEGGRVQRVEGLVGDLPSARRLGRKQVDTVRAVARRRGRALARLGVTMDFAPVVDLGGQPRDAVIGDRAFARRATAVTSKAGAFAEGLRRAGVLPTLKHFPGHGRARGDSHVDLPVTPPWSSLRQRDTVPYHRLTGEGRVAVMVGHLHVPGLSRTGVPSSLDPGVYHQLRRHIGFRGLVVTDDLSLMQAVTDRYRVTQASRRALAAGADMALVVQQVRMDRLLDALVRDVVAGRLSRERVATAAAHVLRAKRC